MYKIETYCIKVYENYLAGKHRDGSGDFLSSHLSPKSAPVSTFISPCMDSIKLSVCCLILQTMICSSSASFSVLSHSSSPAPASSCCLSGRDSSLSRATDSCPRAGRSVQELSSLGCGTMPVLNLKELRRTRRRCLRAWQRKGSKNIYIKDEQIVSWKRYI